MIELLGYLLSLMGLYHMYNEDLLLCPAGRL